MEGDALAAVRSTFSVVGAKIWMGPLRSLVLAAASVDFSVTFGLSEVTLVAFVDGLEGFIGADNLDHQASSSKVFVGRIFFMEASKADDTVVVVLVVPSVDVDATGTSEYAGGGMSSLAGVVEDDRVDDSVVEDVTDVVPSQA